MAWRHDKRGIGILPMFSAPVVESATRKYYREGAQRWPGPQTKEFYREGAKDAKLREEE